MIPEYLPFVANHLWQSTLFAAIASLLALAFRRYRARTRYWIWLAASLKFLVPFSLLVWAGSHIQWRTIQTMPSPDLPSLMEQAGSPFTGGVLASPVHNSTGVSGVVDFLPALVLGVWACGFVAVLVYYGSRWRQATRAKLEPAVFGIFRPVLMLPEGIQDRLTSAQLEAIVAHERCHIHCRDNLASALHMIVEAVFWFHPLVWWLGARLVEERERACDEAVLQSGSEPQVYAEAILKVCKFYVESPVDCTAGVGGGNLNARIERIMAARVGRKLSFGAGLLLTAAGVSAVAAPMMAGLLNAPPLQVKTSKVESTAHPLGPVSVRLSASPKPAPGFGDGPAWNLTPGNLSVRYASLRNIIQRAYGLRDFQIAGGPDWAASPLYQVTAKANSSPTLDEWLKVIGPMFQTLLKDRFKLKFHYERRELPGYALTVTRGGPKLQRTKTGGCIAVNWPPPASARNSKKPICGTDTRGLNRWLNHIDDVVGMNPANLTGFLSGQVGRPVIDKTGLQGRFNFHLEWNLAATTAQLDGKPSSDSRSPSIFTAIQNQLGLKLKPEKVPVKVLVIDHAIRAAIPSDLRLDLSPATR